jgi:FkbM family methyltransferase
MHLNKQTDNTKIADSVDLQSKTILTKITNNLVCINNYVLDKFIVDGLKEKKCDINENEMIVSAPNGLKYRLDFQPYVLFELIKTPDYEFFSNDKDSIFIDIGMNAGFVSLKFAQYEKIKEVHSFEPFKETFDGAIENFKLNPHIKDKIHPYNYGLGLSNYQMELLYEKRLAGNMSLVKNHYDGTNEEFKMENAKNQTIEIKDSGEILSEIIGKNPNKRIIIKCDTEGSEFDIIESLKQSNILNKIDIIMMEYHYKSPKIIEKNLVDNDFIVFYKGGYVPEVTCSMLYAVRNS